MDWLKEIAGREHALRSNFDEISSILKKSYSESPDQLDELAHSVAEIQMMLERYVAEHDAAPIEALARGYPVFNSLRASLPLLCA